MVEGSSEFVFVGSADGMLRAFRTDIGQNALTPAGSVRCSALSFLALGRRREDGSVWVFVSGKFSVQAFVYAPKTGTFCQVAVARTAGSGTHLTTIRDDPGAPRYQSVFIAHYHQHAISAFRFCEQGGFGEEVVIEPGRHAHQVRERGAFLYVPCLGSNYIAQYRIVHEPDARAPRLVALTPSFIQVPGGPRHMALHPHKPKALVVCELESRLELLEIDRAGGLCWIQEASTFTHPDGGAHWSSDVAIRPDGAFAYAINRDPPELLCFSLSEDGHPSRASVLPLSAPVRSFSIAPDGSRLQVGGEDGFLYTISTAGEMRVLSSLSGLGAIRHAEWWSSGE